MQLAKRSSGVRGRNWWWLRGALEAEVSKCLPEGQECVTVEMIIKIVYFNKTFVMLACNDLFPIMGRESRTQSGSLRQGVQMKSQHGLSKTGKKSRGRIMKCSMCCAEEFEFYYGKL